MGTITPAKMQARPNCTNATIDGHEYVVDDKGQITVAVQAHVETLRRHGFTDVVEEAVTKEAIADMDREELTDFIEERGGTVKSDIKIKALRAQVYNAAGFPKEAEKLLAKKSK